MARTQRNQTFRPYRNPKTFNLIRQVKGFLADVQANEFEYSFSKMNRQNRYIPNAYDDIFLAATR